MNPSSTTGWSASDYALMAVGAMVVLGAIAFVVHSVSSRRAFDHSLNELKSGRHPFPTPRGSARYQIAFDSTGFSVSDLLSKSQSTHRMNWAEVGTIQVFKRDLLAVDCICMALSRGTEMTIELNEEMDNWMPFCEALPRWLPGCKPVGDWLMDVATPAFATNLRAIFERNSELMPEAKS